MASTNVPSQFTVAILPLGSISPWQIELTTMVLETEFGVNTLVLPAMEIPAQCLNAERGQYKKHSVLELLFSQLPAEAQRLVGIMAGELESDKNRSSLGCAWRYDRVAVCSVASLSKWERLSAKNRIGVCCITIAHEFVHTLGLSHCQQLDCLMHETAYNIDMCAACRRWAKRELKVQPGSAEERFSLAENYFMGNCLPQAIALYREAIILAPREPLYHNRLAIALYQAKQKNEANHELWLASTLSNDRPGLNYAYGVVFLDNQLEQAEDYFAKAIAATKNLQLTRKIIGQAYREILHDVEKASLHYKEYLRLGGNDQDVVDWLVSRSKLDPV